MLTPKHLLRLTLVLIFAICLLGGSSRTTGAEDLKWSRVKIPSNGLQGNWALAAGSDVSCLTLAPDGTLYCYANPTGTTFRLFKSTDGGYSWGYTGRVVDIIVDIAVAPDNSNCVYYATASGVFKSSDAGNRFDPLGSNPGGAGTGNVKITSLDVGLNKSIHIVVSTCDVDASQYGGVYILEEGMAPIWQDTGLSHYDVYSAALSPHFSTDGQIMAIASDEKDTIITSNINHTGWGTSVADARIAGLVPVSAAIAFPDDYDSDVTRGKYTQFMALNTESGNGDVYCLQGKVDGSVPEVKDLNAGATEGINNLDFTSLAVKGSGGAANLMAGASGSAKVYYSPDGGHQWSSGSQPPSGDSATYVVMAADFLNGGAAFAATSGSESAFSASRDRGASWSQTGLIDTMIVSIADLAISPDFDHDKTLFLLTANVQNSLWYSASGGEKWERTFYGTAAHGKKFNEILLSPQFGRNKKVLLAGTLDGNPVIWKSEDNGRNFTKTDSVDPLTGSPVTIVTWTISSGDVLFVGSFDGSNSMVYQTAANSLTYIDKGKAGRNSLNNLVLSPEYINDKTILAGDINGSLFYSHDNGLVFEPLPFDADKPPLTGRIIAAFDSGYGQNKTVYAASNEANKGIYRFIVGESLSWKSIDGTLPVGAKIGGLVNSVDGLLYGINQQVTDKVNRKGGIERAVQPATGQSPVFETIIDGLDDGLVLNKLWVQGNTLWTVGANSNNVSLWTYTDILTSPPALVSPADKAAGLSKQNVTISWNPQVGANGYQWQVDTDTNFTDIPSGLQGETGSTSVILKTLDADTTYYWRIRSYQPVSGPWSTVRLFDTKVATTPTPTPTPTPSTTPTLSPTSTPVAVPKLSEPKSSSPSDILPIFKWTDADVVEKYELLVSRNDAFTDLVINQVCNVNVWQSNVTLDYNATYYWKVRAVNGANRSNWSDAGLFITKPAPTPSPTGSGGSRNNITPVAPALNGPDTYNLTSVSPTFKWTASEGAVKYELLVSTHSDFSVLVIDRSGSRACVTNSWECDIVLENDAVYYWKVRAIQGETPSLWSKVNFFTTEAKPSLSISPPAATHPPVTSLVTKPVSNSLTPTKLIPPTSVTEPGSGAAATSVESPASKTTPNITTPLKFSPSTSVTPLPTPTNSRESSDPLLYFIIGGLVAVIGGMAAVMIFALKIFKPK